MENKLREIFKLSSFRDGQEEIIQSVMDGKDVLGIMPTGGGKSLCYQYPAVVNDGMTIVISPLIALMKDQVDSLLARNIRAEFINSSQSWEEVKAVIDRMKKKEIDLLYVAPERLSQVGFTTMFRNNNMDVSFVAVDEAHCVSSWGHDFRPEYMNIRYFIENMGDSRPVVGAFTATATTEVREDIVKNLNLNTPQVFVRGFDRPNLHFSALQMKDKDRDAQALKIVKKSQGSGIVYVLTRKKAEATAKLLNQNGINAIAYHAGLNSDKRTKVQQDFMDNKYKVIVATVAFGMGVNKADIRFVVHLGMPGSLENYYQEAGRAGRDGEKASCVLLSSPKDYGLQSFFIQKGKDEMYEQGKSSGEVNEIVNIKYDKIKKIREYVENESCRRKTILNYFSDPDLDKYSDKCDNCDICLDESKNTERDMFFDKMGQEMQEKELLNRSHDLLDDEDEVVAPVNVTDTIRQTIDLFDEGLSIQKIAKVRELGATTIQGHLARYYASGGDLDIDSIVSKKEQSQVLLAMSKVKDYHYLRPIKEQLPSSIGYEKIKMVIAKIKRINI
ncbi:RecQ family ATP-dependent DNA helicase [Candidatus Falkowbacteria bacterium]|jgi:ATP-dependent DNA helicase RecQ|nr:RecQ family ATP-dependent DNA helicase [Candidatus Falkowbacteria bacterium]MBT7007797.1 RecQ family ATP-dependent DNA helicase [Candidatus Falkowbacteria bacterium]